MGIIGVLWIVLIVLKFVGVVGASWALIILWPIPVVLLIWLVLVIFGVTLAGFSSLSRR